MTLRRKILNSVAGNDFVDIADALGGQHVIGKRLRLLFDKYTCGKRLYRHQKRRGFAHIMQPV
jgi:hypothetical protein